MECVWGGGGFQTLVKRASFDNKVQGTFRALGESWGQVSADIAFLTDEGNSIFYERQCSL